MSDLDLTETHDGDDLVLQIEVGARLLAMPYLSSLLRRLCRHPASSLLPDENHLADGIVSLAERVIVEHHRHNAELTILIDLVGGSEPEVRLALHTSLARELAGEVLNRGRAIDRDADIRATPAGLLVTLPAAGARFAGHDGESSPFPGSGYAPRR